MIRRLISTIKHSASFNINEELNRFTAANTIQDLLEQIDFNAEEVPTQNSKELQKLFKNLKGEALNISEIAVIKEISEKGKHNIQQIS